MDKLLSTIESPRDLKGLSLEQLNQLAAEMREALCELLGTRTAHFASNLGVVELNLALHTTFDFLHDRLIWDTGHQIYPHKMITGRYHEFGSIRTKGGLMGYPNPGESPYDLFMTGHAGCSVSTALGLTCGDDSMRPDENRHTVAVIGDGSFGSGIVFEAMNNTGGLKKNLTVVLNDNKMSICPRVGGLGNYFDRLRMTHFYTGLKNEIQRMLGKVPVIGDPVERFLVQMRDAIKAGMHGGMLFEELGFHYLGPVDGHSIRQVQKYLAMARDFNGPVLLHAVTEKGHGFKPAAEDPVYFHTPAPFSRENGQTVSLKKNTRKPYTQLARDAILEQMRSDDRVAVITAAMCQGNMLEPIREEFPERFYDVGICESHAVAFAAGLAKTGMRPVVDIYSTFLQRSYDQIFQEVALQNLPVLMMLDRAGLTGPDGATHHGMFDLSYLRPLPNLVVMAPGDAVEMEPMVNFALSGDLPVAIRYPKASAETIERDPAPIELGTAEVLAWGEDGILIACGTTLSACHAAAQQLAKEGLDVGVINARFVKPLDTKTILRAVTESPFVVTVEESSLAGGFGSAVLEAASDAGVNTAGIHRIGAPDRFIEHGKRQELLDELGLTAEKIAATCRQLAASTAGSPAQSRMPSGT
jgi:1-deoxy-D-xylulose-5-phosphate synthase